MKIIRDEPIEIEISVDELGKSKVTIDGVDISRHIAEWELTARPEEFTRLNLTLVNIKVNYVY